jgi:hypothetical protein
VPDNVSGPPDPYEYGFEVVQRQRQPLPPLPEEPTRRPGRGGRGRWKWTLGGFLLLAVIVLVRGVQATHTGSLKADCTRTQVKLAEHSVVSHGRELLHWSATAAAGVRYVVAINATSVTLDGSVATAVPALGSAGQASRLQTMGHGCLGHGSFGVLLPAGTYPVTLFRIGNGGAATAVVSTTVKVTAS